MAFQTSVLRDGEWVTETVNFHAALQHASAAAAASAPGPTLDTQATPPVCGILSRTVVESPIVHWVLPVRLRSKAHNDIAFIGDHFVQINELRSDGQLHQVARKSDFGARIRSAAVLGDPLEHGLDDETSDALVKVEDSDSTMADVSEPLPAARDESLPPKLLVLVLDTGDIAFLFLRKSPRATLEFVVSKYKTPRKLSFLGFHLAVDPSSHYMAASSPDGVLAMYEINDMSTLNAQYKSTGTFAPVRSVRLRAINGVIHKLEFLYPRPADDYHIILILIIIRDDRRHPEPVTRMVTYEWEVGDNLKEVFADERLGNRLPKEHKLPLLLIPLKFNNAFFTVSPNFIGIVKDCLSGSPVFESLRTDPPSRTHLHHGANGPLWTAWSRPFRRRGYFERTDIIYLAREDGAIIHIEIEANDLVPSVTNVGCLDSNINTAFATAYDVFSDILIIGGDSGPGGVWKLAPRSELEQVSILPNWSPVVDAATDSPRSVISKAAAVPDDGRQSNSQKAMPRPENLFTASGRGLKGSVTQWRWGIQGRIGLDIETGEPIRQSWAFALESQGRRGLSALLSLPHSSAVLFFSEDFAHVAPLGAEDTPFDVASRTLAAHETRQSTIVQVTERSVTLVANPESLQFPFDLLLGFDGFAADNAAVVDDAIVVSTHSREGSQLHTFLMTETSVTRGHTWNIEGEVTCVSLFAASNDVFVIAGSVSDRVPRVSVYSSDGTPLTSKALARSSDHDTHFEPLTSLCVVQQERGDVYVTAGTRCGHLLCIKISALGPERITWLAETMGVAPVEVFPCSGPFDGTEAALMCCDNNLTMMTGLSPRSGTFRKKQSILLTDANDASMSPPVVHSVASLAWNISGYPGHMSLMVQAGSRLLLAEIWPHVGPVPRSIPIGGTPTRLIFSHTWNCLVVALLEGDRPTLAFIDPNSGETLSIPSDKDGNPSDFASGLGHPGDRIYGLYEWLYIKDGRTFSFILVATKDGRLLIISVNRVKSKASEGQSKRLLYWTRYKKVLGEPIYSIVGDDQGIIYCVDKVVHWEVLDLAEKRLRPMGEYRLDSPATSLQVVQGHIFALTTLHSLEIIDYKTGGMGDMALVHSDRITRRTTHMIDAGLPCGRSGSWPVTLLSDQKGGIAGVWVPWHQRNKEFEVVFEGLLPTAVRRFVALRSRPLWLAVGRDALYDTVPSTSRAADIVGVSLDGSLQHFTLVGIDLWRFLYLVQNMARRSPRVGPVATAAAPGATDSAGRQVMMEVDGGKGDYEHDDLEAKLHPRLMHIDGDVLERCLQVRALEKLVQDAGNLGRFCQCLDKLEGGQHTRGFKADLTNDGRSKYFGLAYEILGYLLDPVM